jgi:hypothetical protein
VPTKSEAAKHHRRAHQDDADLVDEAEWARPLQIKPVLFPDLRPGDSRIENGLLKRQGGHPGRTTPEVDDVVVVGRQPRQKVVRDVHRDLDDGILPGKARHRKCDDVEAKAPADMVEGIPPEVLVDHGVVYSADHLDEIGVAARNHCRSPLRQGVEI